MRPRGAANAIGRHIVFDVDPASVPAGTEPGIKHRPAGTEPGPALASVDREGNTMLNVQGGGGGVSQNLPY